MTLLRLALLGSLAWLTPSPDRPRGSVEGRVLDERGAPAANVRVIVAELGHATTIFNTAKEMFSTTPGIPQAEAKRWTAELISDRDGRFRARELAQGEFSVLAADEKRGFAVATVRVGSGESATELALTAPAHFELDVVGRPHDPKRHVLELRPTGKTLNIQWVPRVQPRAGWSVASSPLPAFLDWRVVGTEVVFEQDYRATLFAESFEVAPGERRRLALDLTQGAEIAGIVAGARGEPLSGVSVVARASAGYSERGSITGPDGRYAIRGLAGERHRLVASRWTMREQIGCGNGAQDVLAEKELALPLASLHDADFEIASLLAQPKVGDEAPPFSARTLGGRELALSELRGRVVLLDFWATWCGICRMETARLVQAYEDLARGGRFEIVGVSLDVDPDLVPRFAASRGLRWPQTALGPAETNPIARLFNVNSTPDTVLVDARGRIAALHLTGEPLRKSIEELLARE